ncbi:MAG: DUF3488 and transglutaminase-like domain-containing protein [Amphritea sp.]
MKPVYQLNRNTMAWLLITIVLVIAPHTGTLPLWIYPIAILTIGWRLMVHTGRWRFPHWSVKLAMIIGSSFAVLASLNGGPTLLLTVVLLIVAFLLKLLEMYQRRDALVVLYVAYLVSVTAFLFNKSIPMAVYILITLVMITATLNCVYQSEQRSSFWRPLKRSAILYLQALPMMLILFIMFPRLPPLWTVDLGSGEGRTGMSDTLAPGDVSRLTRSAETAFRVSFEDSLPALEERYWRGIVYDTFDGQRWLQSPESKEPSNFPEISATAAAQALVQLYSYQVILEPTGQRWRYALDIPVDYPASLRLQPDYTLLTDQPLNQRSQYSLTSAIGYQMMQLTAAARQRYLQLPEGGNARAQQQAQQWLEQGLGAEAYLQEILQLFRSRFTYTLQPPRLSGERIDQFLFDTQQGFCGHFASSTVFLLRAAGIPARIIGGYQGGELNPVDGSLTIRQYEAHAWIEVWLPDKGWVRVDPTAAVAPERVEKPAEELFNLQQGFLADASAMRAGLLRVGWLKQLRWQYDALNYSWNRWVLNFQHNQQSFLNGLLNGASVLKLILLLLVPGAVVLGAVAWNLLIRSRQRVAPIEKSLARLDQRLARLGLARAPGETVMNHAHRVAGVIPDVAASIVAVARRYEQIRYAGDNDPRLEKQLYSAIERCYSLLPSR